MKKLEIYWQSHESRERFKVAELFRDTSYSCYIFKYVENVVKYETFGFRPIYPFLDWDKTYKSDNMFPTFASRLPDPKRKDIKRILNKFGMNEYDDFDFLCKSEGRLPMDRLEFIEPLDISQNNLIKDFYVAGVSHHDFCSDLTEECHYKYDIVIEDELELISESNNKYDMYAVRIEYKGKILGYVPKYYSKDISTMLAQNRYVKCKILSKKNCMVDCRECIKVRLYVK